MWLWGGFTLFSLVSAFGTESKQRFKITVVKTLALICLLCILLTQSNLHSSRLFSGAIGMILVYAADMFYLFTSRFLGTYCCIILAIICFSFSLLYGVVHIIIWWVPVLLICFGVILFFVFLPIFDKWIYPLVLMFIGLVEFIFSASENWLVNTGTGNFLGLMSAITFAVVVIVWGTVPSKKMHANTSLYAINTILLSVCYAFMVSAFIY